MNGRVVAVLVRLGERVAAGQPVMTLEAMKMEHVHTAPIAGTISAIDVVEGEQVTTGKIVVEIEVDASARNPVIARSAATKQSRPFYGTMDCFASLAMTVDDLKPSVPCPR